MFSLNGKVALVTGAGQNIGAGIARVIAAQGATLIVNDYYRDRADRTVAEIEKAGGRARAWAFDVSDLDVVTAAIADIAANEGPVDILVNNAGTGGPEAPMRMAPFAKTAPDDWTRILDVNLYGMFNCCKAVLDSMIERRWGRIITISSGAGQCGLDIGVSPYAAAKAGQNGFMRHLAMENGPFGITCNTIAMGLVVEDTSQIQHLVDAIPTRRMGKPEDPGYLAVFLASEEANWITGQTIGMNGGSLMI
jgi:NAD(P)-dependent dehydrogenase (short-subunit alcohol dehydrogenase family)